MSDLSLDFNLYEENLNEETALDLSFKNLELIPEINNKSLCALYLQSNNIEKLPEDFFPTLPNLMWLDIRDNRLTEIPKTILKHPSLSHFILKNNQITTLPNELGTLTKLTVLQLSGNPLSYPGIEIIKSGIEKLLKFLREKYYESIFLLSQSETGSISGNISNMDCLSYKTILNEETRNEKGTLSIKLSEKDVEESRNEDCYTKRKGACPRLAKSRFKNCPSFYQSAKYVKPLYVGDKASQIEKIKQNYLKEVALKKHKDLLVTREKILQEKKNMEQLKNWRKNYKTKQFFLKSSGEPNRTFPYDTSPEYMTLLSREDIEKDLPDKYRKKLVRKSKQTLPRKNAGDVHLALKIKQLFENLEALDINKKDMSPRTEQKVLMGEIQKISEIKQKLMELSVSNTKSVD